MMHIRRGLGRARILAILPLVGSLAFVWGCDSGNGGGESNLAPPTPPPGQSTKEMIEASKKSLGPNGVPPKQGAPAKK